MSSAHFLLTASRIGKRFIDQVRLDSQVMPLPLIGVGHAARKHDQLSAIADLVEAEDVHVAVVSFDFDVAIPGSMPLIDNFEDRYPTLTPTKSSRHCLEARVRVNLNAHDFFFYE